MADDPEITLETYDKHHVKVPKSIATRSAIINMMIEGEFCFLFRVDEPADPHLSFTSVQHLVSAALAS
eukprot:2785854-Rhodomonas_salina.1